MAKYTKAEARDWAWQHFRGVHNVIIPSFTSDLSAINEPAVRHDVRKELEYGFAGALMVSEVVMTLGDYRRFYEIAHDEAAGRLTLIHHASWSNFEENIKAVRIAEANGAEIVLLSYPPNFYPTSPQDIFDYTKAYCDATDLAVMIFPVPLWGFGRLHPSDIEVTLIRRMLDACPNIVAIKAEGGYPSIMGGIECHRHFGKEVLISLPMEQDMVPLAQLFPVQVSATSNTEYFGATIPRIFDLLQWNDYDAATELYWRINPARRANAAVAGASAGGALVNRMQWKYQAWLQGYAGGPLRAPTMRIHQPAMSQLRSALIASGLAPTSDADAEFFRGRFPDG